MKHGIAVCEIVIPVKITFGVLLVFCMTAQNVVLKGSAMHIKSAQYRKLAYVGWQVIVICLAKIKQCILCFV